MIFFQMVQVLNHSVSTKKKIATMDSEKTPNQCQFYMAVNNTGLYLGWCFGWVNQYVSKEIKGNSKFVYEVVCSCSCDLSVN